MCVWEKKEDCFECVATMEGHENEVNRLKRIYFLQAKDKMRGDRQ